MNALTLLLAFHVIGMQGVVPLVAYPDGVQEFERVARPMIQAGKWKPFTPGQELSGDSVIFTLGSYAARDLNAPGVRVIEFFVAGHPIVPGHELVSFEAPVEAWLFLLEQFPGRGEDAPFCVLATSRTLPWSERLVAGSQGRVVVAMVSGITDALEVAAELLSGKRKCSGVVLTNDFDVLDADVMGAFLLVQVQREVPLFGRTRHEVLMGAAATVEPRYEHWDPSAESPVSGQIFYQRDVLDWLGIGRPASHAVWNPQPLTR